MNIQKCYLDSENSFLIDYRSVSEKILSGPHKALWEDRAVEIDTIIVHYMSAVEFYNNDPFNIKKCLEVFMKFDVSAHYIIDRLGEVYSLVPLEKKAWHCGGSIMPTGDGRIGVNDFSIGIELMATEKSGFTDKQYASLNSLVKEVKGEYNINSILGHDEISGVHAVNLGLRSDVKNDPGKLFDWNKLNLK